jgi:cell division protein FtsI/penicillin-binding protein 2
MKPYVVDSVRDNQGRVIKQNKPVLIRKVISVDTAMRIKKILTGVVEEGTGKLGKVEGFTAAGKTGTAQKIEPNGTYSHSKYVASFIGFAPAEDPLLTIVVTVDEPHPYYFGGVVAAPVFQKVAGDVIRYLKVNQIPMEAVSR